MSGRGSEGLPLVARVGWISYPVALVVAVLAAACSGPEQGSDPIAGEPERGSTTQDLRDSPVDLEGLQAEDFGIDPVLSEVVELAVYGTFQELADYLVTGGDPDSAAEDGGTALMSVVSIDDGKLALLLDNGADPNLRDDAGLTAIHVAVIRVGPESEKLFGVERLLAAGADTSLAATDGPWKGKTACDIARDQSNGELELLLC